MKQTVSFSDFRDSFRVMDRLDNFSYGAAEILFNYLEELDPDYELDVIGLCCDYCEEDLEDIVSNYSLDISDCNSYEEQRAVVREYLVENTSLIGETKTGSFLFVSF